MPEELEQQKFTIECDANTANVMSMLFSEDLQDSINPEINPDVTETDIARARFYALFGSAEGLLRVSRLLEFAVPDEPDIALSIAQIAKVITKIGIEISDGILSEDVLQDSQQITQDQIDEIKNVIGMINVDLPDDLQ